jgi:hypothetical protein
MKKEEFLDKVYSNLRIRMTIRKPRKKSEFLTLLKGETFTFPLYLPKISWPIRKSVLPKLHTSKDSRKGVCYKLEWMIDRVQPPRSSVVKV